MTYSNQIHESGMLTIYLGEWEAVSLAGKLYVN